MMADFFVYQNSDEVNRDGKSSCTGWHCPLETCKLYLHINVKTVMVDFVTSKSLVTFTWGMLDEIDSALLDHNESNVDFVFLLFHLFSTQIQRF